MTDFVSQLEQELLSAARRRAKARRRLPRLNLRPVLALAALAAALAAVFVVARPAREPEPPATPPAGFTLPPADRQAPCEAGGQEPTGEPAPDAVFKHIELLRRMPSDDRLPVGLRGERNLPYGTWLPVGSVGAGTERKPLDTSRFYVLPTGDVRTGPLGCGPTQSRGPGACLIFGADPVFTRCFTIAEIEAGRAFTLVDVSRTGAQVLGLVPDGVGQVDFKSGRVHALLPVRENAVQEYLGDLKATDGVTIELDARKPTVLVLNQTMIPGLASAAAKEVRRIGVHAYADTVPPPTRSETVVRVARPGAEPLARRVAKLLGARIEPGGYTHWDSTVEPDVVVLVAGGRMR